MYRDMRILDLIAPITNEGYGKGYRFVGNFAKRTVPTSCCPSWKRLSPVRRSGLFTIPRAGMN
ncbi:hypothetical protein [Paenibacillus darwinianus]|uniref:hypothetical protein n=1 Tax=Paenibacillus darwinianus TaxID=1380763 RepID=UPI002952B1F4|nr:hypothetical protein [Paenibacillus darwinianus]